MKVIVTGASMGIGRGIASYLAMDGFEVGILARSADLMEDLRQSIEEQGGTCFSAACDLRSLDDTSSAISILADALKGVDALINNAGLVVRKNILDIAPDEWYAMMETNINGVFHATRAAIPHLLEAGHGHIINISSISGKVPLPGGSGYAASKYAVTGFSQSLFHELRDYGIKVTTLYPGSVDSQRHRHDEDSDHAWKVQPEEVGQACRDVLRMSGNTCISDIEVRPLRKPDQKS